MAAESGVVVRPLQRRRALGLVAASHAGQHMYSGLLPLTYPAILLAFHLNYATLGLAVGLIGVVGGLTQASAGYVGRRVAARWVLGSQNIVVAICAIVQSLAPTYPLFATGQGLATVGSSQQHPVGSSVAARTYPERRGTALSLTTIGGSVGSLVIPIPGAIMIADLGWRPALHILSIPLFVMGIILLLTFPPVPGEDGPRQHFLQRPHLHLRSWSAASSSTPEQPCSPSWRLRWLRVAVAWAPSTPTSRST